MDRLMLLKLLFFLLLSASLLSTSLAGRNSKLAVKLDRDEEITVVSADETTASSVKLVADEEDVMSLIHERLLIGMNAKDYGRYDPTPALVKPPFKLIPN